MTITLSTLAELAMEAKVPDKSARRLDLTPDFIAGHGKLKLFRRDRLPELIAALAARKTARRISC